jgi:hypothetical protein
MVIGEKSPSLIDTLISEPMAVVVFYTSPAQSVRLPTKAAP